MTGPWKTFRVPDTSAGTFNADVMLLLTDGSVLVHNGYIHPAPLSNANQWLRLTPDQHGNYETGTWSGELNMQYARQGFASGVLADGQVFVIGGLQSTDPASPNAAWSGEIFDPQANEANAWSPIAKPGGFNLIRGDCNGSVLADKRVLLGAGGGGFFGTSNLTAIWDSASNTWSQAGLRFGAASSTTKKYPFEEETFCLLPDDSVLAPAVLDAPKAQRYLPSLDQWIDCRDAPVQFPITVIEGVLEYEMGPIILLPSGAAFAIGGSGMTALYTPPAATDPTGTGSWTQGPTFPDDTSANPSWRTLTALDAPACLLPSGKVVCMGGNAAQNQDSSAVEGYLSLNPVLLEYDPASTATTLPQLDVQPELPTGNYTYQSFFLLLPTGQLLLSASQHAFPLHPRPSHQRPPGRVEAGQHLGVGHGRRQQVHRPRNAAQRPVAGRLRRHHGRHGHELPHRPAHQPADRTGGLRAQLRLLHQGVATGPTMQSCTINIPPDLATGQWNLVVIANGIPSEPVSIDPRTYPCQEILDELENLNPGDFNTSQEFKRAYSYYLGLLKECLKEHGA